MNNFNSIKVITAPTIITSIFILVILVGAVTTKMKVVEEKIVLKL